MNSSVSDFGRDLGLIHEVVITGRKAGWSSADWARCAHSETTMQMLRRIIHGELVAVVPEHPYYPVYVTLKLGIYRNIETYASALKQNGREISPDAYTFLRGVSFAQQETEIDLVELTPSELGLHGGAIEAKAILDRVEELGLEPISPEALLMFAVQFGAGALPTIRSTIYYIMKAIHLEGKRLALDFQDKGICLRPISAYGDLSRMLFIQPRRGVVANK